MVFKKVNAALSLCVIALLVAHVCYSVFSYLTFYYNPLVTKLLAIPLVVATCLHAVLGMCIVFLQADGTRLDLYPQYNRRTIAQRVSAALIFPLLILHMRTFELLKTCAANGQWVLFGLLLLAQACFYAVIILHASVSFSRALVTLGWLSSRAAQQKVDKGCTVFGVLLFVVALVSIVRTQLAMFLG